MRKEIAKIGNQKDGVGLNQYMKMGYIRKGYVLRLNHIAKKPKILWMKACRP